MPNARVVRGGDVDSRYIPSVGRDCRYKVASSGPGTAQGFWKAREHG